jgi:hypothetical protein
MTERDYADGNKQAVALLEKWLAYARRGKVNFAAVVTCESPISAVSEYDGMISSHCAAYVALDQLKTALYSHLLAGRRTQNPDVKPPANLVYYPFPLAPISFDFATWIVAQEMRRIQAGAPAPLKVAFKNLDPHFIRGPMFKEVVQPLLGMVGAVESDEGLQGSHDEVYTLSSVCYLVKQGVGILHLKASPEAHLTVRTYFGGQRPIVVTLREAEHCPHRNSDIEAMCTWALKRGEEGKRVIFVRDTARAAEPLECCDQWFETMPAASLDVDLRLALYEYAECCIFGDNGPYVLALFSDTRFMMFHQPDPLSPYVPEQPRWWKQFHGIGEGEQFPWCRPDQRIMWKPATLENLERGWQDFPKQ